VIGFDFGIPPAVAWVDDTKVTTKMILAGAPILDLYDPEYSDYEVCLREIFVAMLKASRPTTGS
jgi:hypothetical protein